MLGKEPYNDVFHVHPCHLRIHDTIHSYNMRTNLTSLPNYALKNTHIFYAQITFLDICVVIFKKFNIDQIISHSIIVVLFDLIDTNKE